MKTVIIDTNVILVANEKHPDVSPGCIAKCALRLQEIMEKGRIAIDDKHLIMREYLHKTSPETGKKSGDAFLKWVLRNTSNSERCDQVPLQVHPERGFDSFPDDRRLEHFDDADRKFVAVAAAHPHHPDILQAADSKWWDWALVLQEHGLRVDFICEDDLRRFHQHKFGS